MTCALLGTKCLIYFFLSFSWGYVVDEGSANAAWSSSSDSGKLQDLVFVDDPQPHLFKEMRRKI